MIDSERTHKCHVHSKDTAGLSQVLVVSLVNSKELDWKIPIHKSIGRIVVSLIKLIFHSESCSASESSVLDILHYRHITNLRISRRLYREWEFYCQLICKAEIFQSLLQGIVAHSCHWNEQFYSPRQLWRPQIVHIIDLFLLRKLYSLSRWCMCIEGIIKQI